MKRLDKLKIMINLKIYFTRTKKCTIYYRTLSISRERLVVYKTAYDTNRKGSNISTKNKKTKRS